MPCRPGISGQKLIVQRKKPRQGPKKKIINKATGPVAAAQRVCQIQSSWKKRKMEFADLVVIPGTVQGKHLE
jgi:hypothetical protein